MSVMPERMNPSSMPDTGKVGYSQISIADASRLAFVSGQVAWRAEGGAVPETIDGQTDIVIENLQGALDALGAATDDIVQLRLYMTDVGPDAQGIAMGKLMSFLDGAEPSLTGIGVAALAMPELLIEIEMVVQIMERAG